jgi:hypothetical protein
MKSTILILAFLFLILPCVLAINIHVEKQSDNEVYIPGINKPVVFNLKITNYGTTDSFEFYNLVGFKMSPVGEVTIKEDETKDVQLEISPIGELKQRGGYSFSYYIKGKDSSEVKETLIFRIIDFEDLFELGSGEVDPTSNTMKIYIYNKESFNFNEVNAKFSSPFFKLDETFPLGPNQKKEFVVQLNKEDFKELMAGFYTLNAEITAEGKTANLEAAIKFVQQDLLVTTKTDDGIIINTEVITKKNEGNTVVDTETVIKKNIISRVFTSFNIEPTSVDRMGSTVYYSWKSSVQPGEVLTIESKTNWTWPLLCIIFIIIIVILAKRYSESDLVLTKRISFVKAKGGEFALKVSVFVKARRTVLNISLVDRLPQIVQLYEQFGKEVPSRIDQANKRLEWNFDRLEEGEMRVINYIVYSKIGVLGKFALPQATAIYERDGKVKEVASNKAFYMSGQRRKESERN